MLTVQDVSRLIDRIYSAGESGAGWTECLETIGKVLEATGVHLLHYDLSAESGVVIVQACSDPAAMDAYLEYFHRIDPREARLPARALTVGRVLTGQAALLHPDLVKTEYYADFARPFGLVRALFGVTGHHADRTGSAVSINRGDHQPEFGDDEVAFLSMLMPHLGRAMQVRDRWGGTGHRDAALDALDAVPLGVMLIDGDTGVCFANTRASALLAKGDGIATDSGRLLCENAAVTRRLRDLCAKVAATRSEVPRHPGATLLLPRRSSPTPLQALIAPVSSHGAFSVPGRDVAAVIYISDPADIAAPDETLLCMMYGLTRAEARVAALLAKGREADEIAGEFRYTRETVRWYVKQVLAKTGCRTRSQFAARAANSIAMLRSR